jgi:rhodanese-related sulfurtransferase
MPVTRVSATQAVHLQNVGYLMLDVRPPEEYAQSHPKAAVNVPHVFWGAGGSLKPNPDFLKVVEALYPKDRKILVVGRVGPRSLAAAEELVAAGFTDVCEMRPGMKGIVVADGRYEENGWDQLGLPQEKITDGGTWAEMKTKAKI